ncbi:MAG: hypothetical protein ACI4KA_01945 [Oscillospiraceae bacterium]
MEIIIVLVICSLIALTVMNIVMAKKKMKKYVIIFNVIAHTVLASLVIIQCINLAVIDKDRENYDIYGSEIFNKIRYDRTEGDYYLLKQNAFLASSTVFAVPKENADLPYFAKKHHDIYVYCKKGTELCDNSNTVVIGSNSYLRADNVVKIRSDYLGLVVSVGLVYIILLFLLNVVGFIVLLIKKKRSKNLDKM